MKMKHKRILKRVTAGIMALLFAYAASFGSWIVFPLGLILFYMLSKVETNVEKKKKKIL